MTEGLFAGALPDIRQYLRQCSALADLSGPRVFFHIPARITTAPFIRIYRSGGGLQTNSEAPVLDLRVSVDVWGLAPGDFDVVRETEGVIETLALPGAIPLGTVLGDNGVVFHNLAVTTALDSPDPDTGWPRIIADTIWTLSL